MIHEVVSSGNFAKHLANSGSGLINGHGWRLWVQHHLFAFCVEFRRVNVPEAFQERLSMPFDLTAELTSA